LRCPKIHTFLSTCEEEEEGEEGVLGDGRKEGRKEREAVTPSGTPS
jgi:hypothetical protein